MNQILLIGEKVSNDKVKVTTIHYQPNTLSDEVINSGYLVTYVPDPKYVEGKYAVTYYNPEIKEVFYEYEDRPLTPEEKAKQSLKEVKSLKSQNAEIILALTSGGLM